MDGLHPWTSTDVKATITSSFCSDSTSAGRSQPIPALLLLLHIMSAHCMSA